MHFFRCGKLSKKAISLQRLETFRKEISTDAHSVALEELCIRLKTDPVTGLTPQQASELLYKNGPNMLTPTRRTPELVKCMKCLFYGFSALLWIGSLLCFLSVIIKYSADRELDRDSVSLGCVLIVVVVVSGVFRYYQERSSNTIMASFNQMAPSEATVIRNGKTIRMLARDIVIGDLVMIKFGDRIPADIRLVESLSLKVDNSPLTGESDAQTRTTICSHEHFLETSNIVFYSTNVLEGLGKGIVVACGDNTVMGNIAGLTARIKPNPTPLEKELHRFMLIVSCWACFIGIIFGILTVTLGYGIIDSLLYIIGIIVANVPEGLMATVTVSLKVAAQKMVKKNCMIKNLDSVETLGSISVICSDKTGTLTQNLMTVAHLSLSNKIFSSTGLILSGRDDLSNLLRCAALCNRAEFLPDQSNISISRRKARGDASETAILKFIEKIGAFSFRKMYPKIFEVPFSSTTKYQVTIHSDGNQTLLMMKGAPEVILDRCSTIFYDQQTVEMNQELRKNCEDACMHFAERGERVLGFCDIVLDDKYGNDYIFQAEPPNFPIRGLRFVGLISMIDPPRPQVPDAILKCRTAGIKVIMVTGDHPVTAKSIAEKIGIISASSEVIYKSSDIPNIREDKAIVVHGPVLRQISSEELDDILYKYKEVIFARTTPQQKLQIVESFQRLGEIVAVTGDGVNDAPALRKADIGIAMGITGTDVSKEAADMILLDDNFASITTGIEEGRKIFDNLKKSITYTLTSNMPELIPFLTHIIIDIPVPIGIIAILCIDLLTDMLPSVCLAYEDAESDIMNRPPRNPLREKLVSRKLYFLAYGHLGILEALNAFLIYFIVMAEHGFYPNHLIGLRKKWVDSQQVVIDSYGNQWKYEERQKLLFTCSTAVLISVVVSQISNGISCKTRINSIFKQGLWNMPLNVSMAIEIVFVALLAYMPYMYYLEFYPVSYRVWLYSMPFAILLCIFDELRKTHIRRFPKGWFQRETYY